MIIVQLKGGLGNQLFQYAAGLSLAMYHQVPLKVDAAEIFDHKPAVDTARHLDLEKFNCEISFASAAEIRSVSPSSLFQRGMDKCRPCYKRHIYKESAFTYDPHFFKAGNHIYLKGYRQSEQYFKQVEQQVREKFTLRPAEIEPVQAFAERLRSEESVAVHIRRKDYLTGITQKVHGVLPATYYNNAAAYLTANLPNPVFYVFSDDPQWVKENFRMEQGFQFITPDISNKAITDFYLISCCKHQVIANSTFSWWAAYLNSNPAKMVVAPKRWFNEAPHDTKDLIPENWMRL